MSDRPSMPAITPAVGGSVAGAAAFIAFATTEEDRIVRIVALGCAAVAFVVASVCERSVRRFRNETEQTRIQVSGGPEVVITDDPDAVFEGEDEGEE